jgi:hypothetical protein
VTLGIGPRDVLALAREARSSGAAPRPLLVTGVLAEQLARELAAGSDGRHVVASGDPGAAAAVVRVVAGAATRGDEEALRTAARALVPIVVVQTGVSAVRLPYVLATDVVECPPGKGFPIDEIAAALARVLGGRGAALAAVVPVLRPAVERHRVVDAAVAAGTVVALARDEGPRLPVLALAQARMLADLSVAGGREPAADPRATAQTVAVPLGAALGAGLLARSLVRKLSVRGRVLEGAVAAGFTFALGALARSVRPGS